LSGRKNRRRIGTLLFAIPIILLVALVAYQIIVGTGTQTGTLIVEAQSSDKYYSAIALRVPFTVGAQAGSTPMTLTLAQGSYNVSFSGVKWFVTPASKSVTVMAGKDTYAIGVYDPVVEVVSVSPDQFNTTRLSALHGVTPVVWVNHSGQDVVIDSGPTGRVIIAPSQNYTYIFQSAGSFEFSLPLTSAPDLVVSVS
jgi:hypothetical protein